MIDRRNFMRGAIVWGAAAASAARLNPASAASADTIVLTAGERRFSLAPEQMAESDYWLYNGVTPGPQIRARKGDTVRVRLINELPEPTSIHWHGIRIANAMDGVAGLTQDAVEPGGSFDYEFIAPDAGTYWYHAHNRSWNQVARGLYGTLIVEEAEPVYDNDHDLVLMMDDWRINREGGLDLASLGSMMDWSHAGRLGNFLTVNGQFRPKFKLNAGEAYRLRLINASNARIFEFDPSRFDAKILAYDGQSVGEPAALAYSPLLLGPAQRVDLLVTPVAGGDFRIEELSGDEPLPVGLFEITGALEIPANPSRLAPNDLPEPDLADARHFDLNMTGGAMGQFVETRYQGKVLSRADFRTTKQVWAFNGVANLAEEPFFSVQRGQSVVVDVRNSTAFPHAMHVHGHHFRVIEREGSDVEEGRPWRDTFMIGADQTTRIAFVADNPGKWLLHCHMLEHAAAGMNTWFEIV